MFEFADHQKVIYSFFKRRMCLIYRDERHLFWDFQSLQSCCLSRQPSLSSLLIIKVVFVNLSKKRFDEVCFKMTNKQIFSHLPGQMTIKRPRHEVTPSWNYFFFVEYVWNNNNKKLKQIDFRLIFFFLCVFFFSYLYV